jgi:hypothetical protein
MNPEIKERWIAALTSGDYSQTKRKLGDENGYCCLGVLCEIAVEDGVVMKDVANHLDNAQTAIYFSTDNPADRESAVLPASVRVWAGLPHSNPSAYMKSEDIPVIVRSEMVYVDETVEMTLAPMNDGGVTFAEMAELIKKYF